MTLGLRHRPLSQTNERKAPRPQVRGSAQALQQADAARRVPDELARGDTHGSDRSPGAHDVRDPREARARHLVARHPNEIGYQAFDLLRWAASDQSTLFGDKDELR